WRDRDQGDTGLWHIRLHLNRRSIEALRHLPKGRLAEIEPESTGHDCGHKSRNPASARPNRSPSDLCRPEERYYTLVHKTSPCSEGPQWRTRVRAARRFLLLFSYRLG